MKKEKNILSVFHKIDNQLMKEIYIGDIEYDENGEERINHKVEN